MLAAFGIVVLNMIWDTRVGIHPIHARFMAFELFARARVRLPECRRGVGILGRILCGLQKDTCILGQHLATIQHTIPYPIR